MSTAHHVLERPLWHQDETKQDDGFLSLTESLMSPRLTTGQLLAGRYLVKRLIGCGGTSEVYQAEDRLFPRDVAIKALTERLGCHSINRSRLLAELELAQQAPHRYVCQVYDVTTEDGQPFLVMEYIEGESLRRQLRRLGPPSRHQALSTAIQICRGLAAAHSGGVIHHDLKPSNIMIDDRGRARIMDFGLATFGRETLPGGGTLAYMAPERAQGHEGDERSDLFSLGLVLFELFSREPATLGRHADRVGPRALLRHRLQGLGSAVIDVILHCLAEDPSARPGSAKEVAEVLEAAIDRDSKAESRRRFLKE